MEGGDRVSIRRTAKFFLDSFEVGHCSLIALHEAASPVMQHAKRNLLFTPVSATVHIPESLMEKEPDHRSPPHRLSSALVHTAKWLLFDSDSNLQERLRQQKEEAKSNPDYNKNFKGQLSKEEKTAKRKQILSSIGELLLLPIPFAINTDLTSAVHAEAVLVGACATDQAILKGATAFKQAYCTGCQVPGGFPVIAD